MHPDASRASCAVSSCDSPCTRLKCAYLASNAMSYLQSVTPLCQYGKQCKYTHTKPHPENDCKIPGLVDSQQSCTSSDTRPKTIWDIVSHAGCCPVANMVQCACLAQKLSQPTSNTATASEGHQQTPINRTSDRLVSLSDATPERSNDPPCRRAHTCDSSSLTGSWLHPLHAQQATSLLHAMRTTAPHERLNDSPHAIHTLRSQSWL